MNARIAGPLWVLGLSGLLLAQGCASPYRSDQGALLGGLGGAGLGALVGSATGNVGPGAAIGAGVGALSGAAVGGALDDIEASNRAEIAARLGRPAPTGSVTIADVVAMSHAGVPEQVIVTHIRSHGPAQPLQAGDLIALQQQGISPAVVQALQTSTPQVATAGPPSVAVVEAYPPPPPVYWGPPCGYTYYGPYYRYRPYRRRPGAYWGVSIGN